MIVKDEEHTLKRCLSSVLPWIDSYVICDTGSSDRTVDIVKEVLAERKGLIHHIDFKNFQQARNQALDLARQSPYEFDYFLFIDADMELEVFDETFRNALAADAFEVEQRSPTICYSNVRLLKRSVAAYYVGATHEYLHLPGQAVPLEGVMMLDHVCGSSRAHKSERDLALLKSAVDSNPKDTRSLFYLAQTLREAQRYHEAIICYHRRIALGGWAEEVWYSQFMMAACYLALEDLANFTLHSLNAYDRRPTRSEPLYALAKAYRRQKLYQAAAIFAELGLAISYPREDRLFLEHEVYNSLLRFELSMSGYYCQSAGLRQAARAFSKELALERQVPAWVRHEARSHWRFHALSAEEIFPKARFYVIDHPLPHGYYPCNPSVVFKEGVLWCVLRSVNYVISESGEFIVPGGDIIRTQNYLLKLGSDFQVTSSVPVQEVAPRAANGLIEGLEDIRLLPMDRDFLGIATLVADPPDYRRRPVTFTLNEQGLASDLRLQDYQNHLDQKTWIPFKDSELVGYIYLNDPFMILRWSQDSGQATPWLDRASPLALDHLRGSSQAIAFDGGWLYLTHEVSFQQPHRFYWHRFVQLDESFRLKALSEAFYFKAIGVEFCCGMVYDEPRQQLILSFGRGDNSAWLMTLSPDDVRACLEAVVLPLSR